MAVISKKDFYDLRLFAGRIDLNDALVGEAVRATFQRRKTDLPTERPLAFSSEFAGNAVKQRQWAAFLKKSRLDKASLPNTIAKIWEAFGRHVLKEPPHKIFL